MKSMMKWSLAIAASAFTCALVAQATELPIPRALNTLESSAEDTYDLALSGAFAKVTRNADSIRATWARYRSQATRDGIPKNIVAAMDSSVVNLVREASQAKQGENLKLARVANAVSADMDQFYSAYHPNTPPGIMKLDFLGRELVLDGMAREFSLAKSHLADVSRTWTPLRQLINLAGGTKEAKVYDQELQALQLDLAKQDGPAVVKDANVSLEDLDAMEKLYL